MSSTTPTKFGPYPTRAELAKGRRRTIVGLVVALVAVVGAVVAARTVGNVDLVVVYLLAGVLHFVASLGSAVRWSRTPEFGPAD
ncbi:MAG TPA: hypothetical protein VGE14_03990 [Marmoricola sp.]